MQKGRVAAILLYFAKTSLVSPDRELVTMVTTDAPIDVAPVHSAPGGFDASTTAQHRVAVARKDTSPVEMA